MQGCVVDTSITMPVWGSVIRAAGRKVPGLPLMTNSSSMPLRMAIWGKSEVRRSPTRTGFLTFVGFVLIAKGSSVAGVGLALALVFAGGAAGKFVCGLLAERLGVIRTVVCTEAATTLGILTVLLTPLPVALATLVPLGVALNGTSSVLYGTVADLVLPERRSRAYALYYTLTMVASSLSPTRISVGVFTFLMYVMGELLA